MNWTGGRLQQASKGGGNGLAARQKLHFARARMKMQNGHQQSSPFRPSFWESNEAQGDWLVPSKSSQHTAHSHHHQQQQRRQQTLYDYEETAPVARRLASLTPASLERRHKRKRNSYEEGKRGSTHDAETPTRTLSVGADRKRRRTTTVTQARGSSPVPRSRSDVSKPRDSVKASQPAELGKEDLEYARQKLLNQPDWMRLKPAKPLQIHFPSTAEKERIGKRRKLNRPRHHDADFANGRRIVSPFQNKADGRGPYLNGALRAQEDIRIRIGPDALLSQMSSRWSATAQRHIESSDSMLLDAELATTRPLTNPASPHQAGSSSDSTWIVEDEEGRRNRHLSHAAPFEVSTPEVQSHNSGVSLARATEKEHAHMLPVGGNRLSADPAESLQRTSNHELPSAPLKGTASGKQERETPLKKPLRLIFQSSSSNHQDPQQLRMHAKVADRAKPKAADRENFTEAIGLVERDNGEDEWKKFLAIPEEEDAATQAFLDDTQKTPYDVACGAQDNAGIGQSSNTYIDPAGSEYNAAYAEDLHEDENKFEDATSSEFMGFSSASKAPASLNDQLSQPESLKQLDLLAARHLDSPTRQPVEPKQAEKDADELWKSFVFGDDYDSEDAMNDILNAERDHSPIKYSDSSYQGFNPSTAAVQGDSSSSIVQMTPCLQRERPERGSSQETVGQSEMQLSLSSLDVLATEPASSSAFTSQTQHASSMSNDISSTEPSDKPEIYTKYDSSAPHQPRLISPTIRRLQKPNLISSSMRNHVSESSDELSSSNPIFAVGQSSTTLRDAAHAAAPPKVLFSRPAPFKGTSPAGGEKILHLGRRAANKSAREGLGGRRRKMERFSAPMYDMPENELNEEDDGIEDD